MLEGLDEETNPTARLRRLLIAAKILKPSHGKSSQVDEAAKGLVADLGFVDTIAHLRDVNIGGGGDAPMTNDLAAEVCLILS